MLGGLVVTGAVGTALTVSMQRRPQPTLVQVLTENYATRDPVPNRSPLDQKGKAPKEGMVGHLRLLITKKLTPLWGGKRTQQLQEIAGGRQEISEAEKRANRAFRVASTNLGITALSFLYSPLIVLTIPGLIYCAIPLFRLSYQSIKERRVSSYTLDMLLLTGILLGRYWAAGTVGIWIFTGGRKLLLKSEDHSKQSLMNLFGKQPRSVWLLANGVEVEIPFEKLQAGDVVMISAGQAIPVDGIITAGFASIDQHILTGESKLVEKGVGDSVLASTMVLAGRICVETQKTGTETVAMQIGKVLQQTADFKSLIQSRGEVIADRTMLPTLGLSAIVWPFFGLGSALAVLTNTFGYRMRIFAPASMLTFLNIASRRGILIKDGRSLDLLNTVDTIIFDKTGTLTLEQPTVGRIYTCGNGNEHDILRYAAAAEYGQTHPIARAILTAATARGLDWPKLDHAKYEVGYGLEVQLADRIIRVGSERFMAAQGIPIPPEIQAAQEFCHEQGDSLIMVAINEQLAGAIELHATLRPETKRVIEELRQRKMSIYIISGDHEQPTQKLAQALGVDDYFANTLPENKAALVTKLQKEGKSICFVGDGINDAIALKTANVSVSLRGATTMATDTAQIVLMDGSLNQLWQLFDMVQDFEANMQNNLLIATIPSVVCIGGILIFQWSILTGFIISGSGLLVGLGNILLPLFRSQSADDIG